MSDPSTSSNSNALPPRLPAGLRSSSLCPCGAGDLLIRSAIPAISRTGETFARTRASSPSRSSSAMKSDSVSVPIGPMLRPARRADKPRAPLLKQFDRQAGDEEPADSAEFAIDIGLARRTFTEIQVARRLHVWAGE